MNVIICYFFQTKVENYKSQCHTMEARLLEVNQLANSSQQQLSDTTDVLKTIEARLKATEVRRGSTFPIFYCVQGTNFTHEVAER